jgi:putative effector of murein hydrolase LrgA (UPF0299 family)
MTDQSPNGPPLSLWRAYLGLLGVGAVVGFLSGADVIAAAAIAVFLTVALSLLMLWGAWRLDPDALKETDAYRSGHEGKG